MSCHVQVHGSLLIRFKWYNGVDFVLRTRQCKSIFNTSLICLLASCTLPPDFCLNLKYCYVLGFFTSRKPVVALWVMGMSWSFDGHWDPMSAFYETNPKYTSHISNLKGTVYITCFSFKCQLIKTRPCFSWWGVGHFRH